jgi:LEA14-like dessication related protein
MSERINKSRLNKLLKSKWFQGFVVVKLIVKVLVLAFVLNSCMTYEDVQFKGVSNFKVDKIDKEKVKLKFDARVYNPNNYNITVRANNLDVGLSGNSLAKASLGKKVVIKKNSTESYPVEVVVKMKDLMSSLGSSVLNMFSSKSVKLEISGDAKVGAKGLSKKFPLNFDYPIDIGDLNLGGGALDFLK